MEAFIFLAGGNLRGGLKGDFQGSFRIFISSPGVPFQGHSFTDWSVTGQKILGHCSWSRNHPPGFAAFLCLELKYN